MSDFMNDKQNILLILHFLGIKKEPNKKFVPRTVMIGGKVGVVSLIELKMMF